MPETPSLTCRGCHRLLIPRSAFADAALEVRKRWRADGMRVIQARGLCRGCYEYQRVNGEQSPQPIRTLPAAPKGDEWTLDAACPQIDPAIFYPDTGHEHLIPQAKRICATCPVRTECLGAALERGELHGVWGGMTPRERQALKRESAA